MFSYFLFIIIYINFLLDYFYIKNYKDKLKSYLINNFIYVY